MNDRERYAFARTFARWKTSINPASASCAAAILCDLHDNLEKFDPDFDRTAFWQAIDEAKRGLVK